MTQSIQRVELSRYDISIHCPFCGKSVLNNPSENGDEAASQKPVDPCEHTLFVASDEGFEYRSAPFNLALGFDAQDNEACPDLGEGGYDEFTDKVSIENSIKLAIHVPAPSGMGAYVGFAPLADK